MASLFSDGKHAPQDEPPVVQSRETGDLIPEKPSDEIVVVSKASPFAKSWAHFVAGG